jgi:hypothetical protein
MATCRITPIPKLQFEFGICSRHTLNGAEGWYLVV